MGFSSLDISKLFFRDVHVCMKLFYYQISLSCGVLCCYVCNKKAIQYVINALYELIAMSVCTPVRLCDWDGIVIFVFYSYSLCQI